MRLWESDLEISATKSPLEGQEAGQCSQKVQKLFHNQGSLFKILMPLPPWLQWMAPTFLSIMSFLKIFILFYYYYYFLAVLGLCCSVRAFSTCGAGATLRWGERASHCGGFSCCGARALDSWASLVAARGLSSCGSRALERRLSSCGAQT